jgi:hypothetical protein
VLHNILKFWRSLPCFTRKTKNNADAEQQGDEIRRKVGRNVLLFQRIELILKYLEEKGNFSISSNNLQSQEISPQSQARKLQEFSSKQPLGLGGRIKKLTKGGPLSEPNNFPAEMEVAEGGFSFAFDFSYGTSEDQERLKEKLSSIVDERNRLIHELLLSFDVNTEIDRNALEVYLDRQYEKTLPVFEECKQIADILHKIIKNISSEQFTKITDKMVPNDYLKHQSVKELVVCLSLYSDMEKKLFGWTSIAGAKKFIEQQFPEAIRECQKKFRWLWIKKILLKIGVLYLMDLPSEQGKHVAWYRLKPEYSIEKNKGKLFFCKQISLNDQGDIETYKVDLNMSVQAE